MTLLLRLLCVAVAAINLGASEDLDEGVLEGPGHVVVCSYYGWAGTRPHPMNYQPQDIPGDLCTHINFAYAGIDASTYELKSQVPEYEADRDLFKNFTSIKDKHPSLRMLLSIGGWEHDPQIFSLMVSTKENRGKFLRSLLTWMTEYGFDGADLNWMYPAVAERSGVPADRANYVLLMKEIAEAFGTRELLLTVTIPIVPKYLDAGFDVPELSKHVAWFNVHTFDLRGRWDGVTDVHSPLYNRSIDIGEYQTLNMRSGLKKLMGLGAPKSKLVAGIPFFGRQFVLLNEEQHGLHAIINPRTLPNAGPFVRSVEVMGYYEICLLLRGGWTREFDNEGKCPYAYHRNQWVGYEDTESIEFKANFILEEDYGGVYVFNVDLDDFRGICGSINPLLKVINANLRPNLNRLR